MFSGLVGRARSAADKFCGDRKYRHIAFILKGKKVVCWDYNKSKTHPRILKHPYHKHCANIHAELAAIIRYGETDCSDCGLVVVRVRKDGSLANSKPCQGCQHVLEQVGFKRVYYSNELGGFSVLW